MTSRKQSSESRKCLDVIMNLDFVSDIVTMMYSKIKLNTLVTVMGDELGTACCYIHLITMFCD